MSDKVINELFEVLKERKGADPEQSYVASLYGKGTDHILKKIGEESAELIIAAKDGDAEQVIYETADLWFHSLVLLAHNGIDSAQLLAELQRRFGVSGLEEKARRKQQ